MSFQRVIVVDWSAASRPHPTPRKDAIWLGIHDAHPRQEFMPTRAAAEARLRALIAEEPATLIGFDFPLGAPSGLALRLTGTDSAPALWHWLQARIEDAPDNRNNRFQVAAGMNRALGAPAFWGRPASLDLPDLPARKLCDYDALGLPEHRACERLHPGTQPFWKLYTTGSVGSQALMGLPLIARLSRLPGVSVWPWDATGPTVLAEVWPSVLAAKVRAAGDAIKDRAQVRLLAQALHSRPLPPAPATPEGWILTP